MVTPTRRTSTRRPHHGHARDARSPVRTQDASATAWTSGPGALRLSPARGAPGSQGEALAVRLRRRPRRSDEALDVLAAGRRRRQGARRRAEPAADAEHAAGGARPPGRHQPARRAGLRARRGRRRAGRRAGPARRRRARRGGARVLPLLRPGAAAGRAPGDPQPGHDGRQHRARRPERGDDRRAGADRRQRRRSPAPGSSRTSPAGRLLPRAAGVRPALRASSPSRPFFPACPARHRHDVRRGRPAARRLRGLRRWPPW